MTVIFGVSQLLAPEKESGGRAPPLEQLLQGLPVSGAGGETVALDHGEG